MGSTEDKNKKFWYQWENGVDNGIDGDTVEQTEFITDDIRDNNSAVYHMLADNNRVISNATEKDFDEMSARFIRTFA